MANKNPNHTRKQRDLPFQIYLLQIIVQKWTNQFPPPLPQSLNPFRNYFWPLIPHNQHEHPLVWYNINDFKAFLIANKTKEPKCLFYSLYFQLRSWVETQNRSFHSQGWIGMVALLTLQKWIGSSLFFKGRRGKGQVWCKSCSPKCSGFIIHAHFIHTCIGGSVHSEQVGLTAHVMQSYLSGISGCLRPRYTELTTA